MSHFVRPPPGPQYGSVERAWLAVMTEAEKVSELHQDVKNNLTNEDVEKVKNWQKEAYHKQMIGGFKEAKEADEGFKKAQKPWAKKLKEVRGMETDGCDSSSLSLGVAEQVVFTTERLPASFRLSPRDVVPGAAVSHQCSSTHLSVIGF